MNFVQLVGRIHDLPVAVNKGNSRRYSRFSLGVTSNFRNVNGKFDVDLFKVQLWRGADRALLDKAQVDDFMAVKGRLEYHDDEIIVIAEHIEFLRLK